MICNFKKSSLIAHNRKPFIGDKYSIINAHDTSRMDIEGTLKLNEALPIGSKKECLVTLCENSVLNIKGTFCAYYDTEIYLFKNAKLSLGWSYINAGTQIRCMEKISIGDQCAIGRNVMIMDFDAHDITYADGSTNCITKPVVIEDHVWIGVGSTILKGVTIGKGSIVGAGSVVTKDVPPNTIVAGNPARVIKENISWK